MKDIRPLILSLLLACMSVVLFGGQQEMKSILEIHYKNARAARTIRLTGTETIVTYGKGPLAPDDLDRLVSERVESLAKRSPGRSRQSLEKSARSLINAEYGTSRWNRKISAVMEGAFGVFQAEILPSSRFLPGATESVEFHPWPEIASYQGPFLSIALEPGEATPPFRSFRAVPSEKPAKYAYLCHLGSFARLILDGEDPNAWFGVRDNRVSLSRFLKSFRGVRLVSETPESVTLQRELEGVVYQEITLLPAKGYMVGRYTDFIPDPGKEERQIARQWSYGDYVLRDGIWFPIRFHEVLYRQTAGNSPPALRRERTFVVDSFELNSPLTPDELDFPIPENTSILGLSVAIPNPPPPTMNRLERLAEFGEPDVSVGDIGGLRIKAPPSSDDSAQLSTEPRKEITDSRTKPAGPSEVSGSLVDEGKRESAAWPPWTLPGALGCLLLVAALVLRIGNLKKRRFVLGKKKAQGNRKNG